MTDFKGMKNQFLMEIDSLRQLKHPGIIQLYDVYITSGDKIFIIMELLEGGEWMNFRLTSAQWASAIFEQTHRRAVRLCGAEGDSYRRRSCSDCETGYERVSLYTSERHCSQRPQARGKKTLVIPLPAPDNILYCCRTYY